MRKAINKRRLQLAGIFISSVFVTGCVTTQGPGGLGLQQPSLSGFTDTFSSEMREFKKLTGEGKLKEADAFFIEKSAYFKERLSGREVPPEFEKVGAHVWANRYQGKVASTLQSLRQVTSLENTETWPTTFNALLAVRNLTDAVAADVLLQLTKTGVAEMAELDAEVKRVSALAVSHKPAALLSVAPRLLAGEKGPFAYVYPLTLDPVDFQASEAFQDIAVGRVTEQSKQGEFVRMAELLEPYLSPTSKTAVDTAFAALIRKEFMADGRVTLDEITKLGSVRTPYGGGQEALGSMASIGYLDLTAASFKNRNVFDFQITFTPDLTLKLSPATEAVFAGGDLSGFDFVFVTDLTVAKVSREFKTNLDVKSRYQSGTRSVHNPDYVTAQTNYQRAMADMQNAQFRSSQPKACAGFGCALIGLADGIAVASTRARVEQASAALSTTPPMLDQPVFSEYTYRAVDINANKTADVHYYVIDVKGKTVLKSSFQVNDHEAFNVAYNLRDDDPDRSSITRNLKNEEEVVAWEKEPLVVSLAALFAPENLSRAEKAPFRDSPTFLASLSSRTYANAAPSYGAGASTTRTATVASPDVSTAPSTGSTIADSRYDSILIVRNDKGMGTGFYVTPDLVLTAYHVVQGSSLVEMTYYDGTKTYGRVVDHDVRLDLALIRPQQAGKPLSIHSGPLRLGETVEAIGHPKGYEFTITRGVISAMRKQKSANIGSSSLVEFVQTDTPISQGNSGGPLFLNGAVIGVNDWIRVDKGSQNLNFSVSFNEIRSYLDRFARK